MMKLRKLQKLLAKLLICLMVITNTVLPIAQAADVVEQTAMTQEETGAQDADKKTDDVAVFIVDKSQMPQTTTTEDTERKSKTTDKEKTFQFGNKLMSHYVEQGKFKGVEWLKTTNLNFYISEDFKPTYSLETLQPLGKRDNAPGDHWFWQGRYAYSTDTATANFGVGWRTLAPDKHSLFGMNLFYDYGFQYDLARIGIGGEYFNKLSEYRFNVYHPLTGDKQTGVSYLDSGILYSYIRAVDGADFEMGTSFPRAQWLKAFLKGYYYDNQHNEDEVGYQLRTTMQVSPRFNLELGYRHSNLTHEPYATFKYQLADTKKTTRKEKDKKEDPYDLSDKLLQFVERENDIKTETWTKFVAYKGNIKTVVTNSINSTPLVGAVVQVYQNGSAIGSAVTTDSSGTALASGLDTGTYTVQVTYGNITGTSSSLIVTKDQTASAAVSLAVIGGSATVTVVDESASVVNGASVTATLMSASSAIIAKTEKSLIDRILGVQSAYAATSSFSVPLTTDSNGVASFTNLQSGTYIFTVTSNGKTMKSYQIDVASGSTCIVKMILPDSGGNLDVTVKDESGSVARGANVVISLLGGTPVSQTTGSDGIVKFSGLAAGTYTVSVQLSGYATHTDSVVVTNGETADFKVTLNPLTTSSANIQVTFADGSTNVTPSFYLDGASTATTNATIMSGAGTTTQIYTISGLTAGSHSVIVKANGEIDSAPFTATATVATPNMASVTLNPLTTSSANIQVTFADGSTNVTPSFYIDGASTATTHATIMSGAGTTTQIYTISGLTAGSHSVIVKATGEIDSAPFTATATVATPSTASVTLNPQTVYVTATAGTNGTITYGTSGTTTIAAGTTVSIPVNYGASLTLNFVPNTHYKVSGVTVGGDGKGAITSYTLSNITSSVAVSSSYAEITYLLTITATHSQVKLELQDTTAGSFNVYTVPLGDTKTVTLYSTHRYGVCLYYNYNGSTGYNNMLPILNGYPTGSSSYNTY